LAGGGGTPSEETGTTPFLRVRLPNKSKKRDEQKQKGEAKANKGRDRKQKGEAKAKKGHHRKLTGEAKAKKGTT
jgi:hypothetical protein